MNWEGEVLLQTSHNILISGWCKMATKPPYDFLAKVTTLRPIIPGSLSLKFVWNKAPESYVTTIHAVSPNNNIFFYLQEPNLCIPPIRSILHAWNQKELVDKLGFAVSNVVSSIKLLSITSTTLVILSSLCCNCRYQV